MTARWTVLVYMAGDNNLEEYGTRDLMEMKAAGSTDQVHILVQFDRMSDAVTRRYHISHEGSLEEDCVEELGETNCGDPEELIRFAHWGLDTYPAERTMLILWNHGSGWKEDDVYRIAHTSGFEIEQLSQGHVRSLAQRRVGKSLFATSLAQVLSIPAEARAICFDDSSEDFLDNMELSRALATILSDREQTRFDILGFDACLMNMIEVAFQVRSYCDYVVGSQETEPGDGWPYHTVLSDLVSRPEMEADELAGLIVDHYIDYYDQAFGSYKVTQSCLQTNRISTTMDALNALCQSLIENIEDDLTYAILIRAARSAQKFTDPDYLDLFDFARLLHDRSREESMLAATAELMATIHPISDESFVRATRHLGSSLEGAYGVSIYFPASGRVSPFYPNLDFTPATRWHDLLELMG